MEDFEKFKIKPQIGDILMTRITAGIIGDTAVIEKDEELGYYVSLALIRKKAEINSYFLNYYINSPIFKHELHKKIIHVAFPKKINLGDIGSCYIKIPILTEQEKIASFLTSIDNLISTQESNISILETYNRGLISQIFKQEIRFKDNNENDYPEWKSKKLGDCVTVKRGSSPRPIEKYITNDDNGINWIKIGDAPIDGNIITEVKEKITIEGAGKSRRVYVGDLILSNSMSFGRPYILEVDGCIHDGWLLIRDERNIFDLKYLCYLLNSEEVIRQYGMYAAGSTVNNLNSELVQSVKIQLPCLEEQQKIADFLSAIDKVAEQEKVYLEQLKTIKKGLLQQMFV